MVDKKTTFPDCNEYNLKTINKRETIGGKVLVPAAAVIPAPLAYTNFAAVEKLVVGFVRRVVGSVLCTETR